MTDLSSGSGSATEALVDFLSAGPVVVLTGAGCSTESGIPDYRSPGRVKKGRGPIQLQEFMGSVDARRRYWARSSVGWERFARAGPNAGHSALARLEHLGVIHGIITQNVDGLHQAAGSRQVLDLHGNLGRVRCMECEEVEARSTLQERIRELNPDFRPAVTRAAPDGDADLPDTAYAAFRVPACRSCGGVLKPDVVFFGECVPRDRLHAAWNLFEAGRRLLVLGSSLTVFSGRRFVLKAGKTGRPVGIVNLGPTRGDQDAELRVEARLGDLLPRVAEVMATGRMARPA